MKEDESNSSIIFTTYPPYAQIPSDLLSNPEISLQAKALYGIYHMFSFAEKDLRRPMPSLISQGKIAEKYSGVSREYISKLTRILEDKGWLFRIQRGLGKCNIIILFGRKQEVITIKTIEPVFPILNTKIT